jgi:D-arabinose 1-dehydrogenase-like Zn-dependent alcohol dehydrogenase
MGTLSDFKEVMSLVFAGKLYAPIDSTFAFADIRTAHEKLDKGDVLGKIVLIP